MVPNHIQTCLCLLVKLWQLAVPVGKISRWGHSVTASADSGVHLLHCRFERSSVGLISVYSL